MIKKLISLVIILFVLGLLVILGINFYVKLSTKEQIKEMTNGEKVDAIVVLGASIRKDGSLSPMLKDRLITAIEAYNLGISNKIIMTGDHSGDYYNEVTAMKNFAVASGIDSNDIYLDHYGVSTYDSIYRIKSMFKLNKIAIVTQKYHLYRALHISNKLGIKSYGIDATKKIYVGQEYRDFRELLARNKDFVKTIIKPESPYPNKSIDINASGDLTD